MIGTVVTVTSSKGGVGKTTFANSLGVVYAKIGYKTLVIDTNTFFGGVSISFAQSPIVTLSSVIRQLDQIEDEEFTSLTLNVRPNLYIIPAPIKIAEANAMNAAEIKKVIKHARETFDVVILDTSNDMTMPKLVALDAADAVTMLITGGQESFKNTRTMLDFARSTNKIAKFSPVYYDAHRPSKNKIETVELEMTIGQKIDAVFTEDQKIPNPKAAINAGKTLFEANRANIYKATILEYAQNLLNLEVK